MTEICAVLAFSAINNNDKVGVVFFSDGVEKLIPPKKGKQHILRIIRELIDFEPAGHKTNIGSTLEYFSNVVKKRSICFLISDFLTMGYETPLRIAARRHDLIGINIIDPREETLPNIGLIRAKDAESGKIRWIDTASKKLRKQYAKWHDEHIDYFKTAFKKSGASVVNIRTNESYVDGIT